MEERFVVSIEGVAYEFDDYKEAKMKYEALKECGYHEAILKVYSPSFNKTLIYNDKAHCLFAM